MPNGQGGPTVVGDGEIRASDSDRESVVAILRDAHGEGRLTLDEFDERMNAAYSAKTYANLRELTRDLPVDPVLGAGPGRLRPAVRQLQGSTPARRAHIGPMLPVLALVWVALAGAGRSGSLVIITAALIFIMVVRLTARHRHDNHDRRPGAGPR